MITFWHNLWMFNTFHIRKFTENKKWIKLVPKIVLDEDEYNQSLAKGGELEALKAMQKYIWKEERIKNYVGSSDSCSPGKTLELFW